MARFNEMRIFSGTGNPALAEQIASYLNIRQGELTIQKFENDNIFVKLHESVREQDVFVVQSLGLPLSDLIMELLILLDTCKRASAGRLTAIVPYYAYGRTDKKDQPRVPITARLLADLITAAGADRVVTIDLHAGQIQGFFKIPVDEMSAMHLLVQRIRSWNIEHGMIVSPGLGFAKRARNVAEALDLPLALIEKRKPAERSDSERVMNLLGDVRGKHCVMVDDEIGTGQTLIRVAELLKEHGAAEISACATHAVFAAGAPARLRQSPIGRIAVTDTLHIAPEQRWPGLEIISIAPLLGEVIQRIHTGVSVGALFLDGHKNLGRW